jgi:hypothetical protein
VVPGAAVAIGLVYLGIGVAHHEPATGGLELLVMLAAAGALVLWRGRSEPAALLAGDSSDERRAMIQLRASAATGRVLAVLVVAGLLWSLATDGPDAGVFGVLCAVTGVTTVVSTTWCSRRG